jgi:capsular exopolysaccharide synthesis family protein
VARPRQPDGGLGKHWERQKGLTLSEASTEPAVRLGPVVASLARSIWRQRNLVAVGLVLGLALGMFVLPKALSSRSTYEATVRMQILQSPADAIFQIAPAISAGDQGGSGGSGGSPELLKDLAVANAVAKGLGPAADSLTGTELLDNLTVTPIGGSPFVDLSYSSGNPGLASSIVLRYGQQFAARRNAGEQDRLDRGLTALQQYAQKLKGSSGSGSAAGGSTSGGSTSGGGSSSSGGSGSGNGANPAVSPYQALIDQINAAKAKQLITGQPTSVVTPIPSVIKTGTPVSRQVTLALGLLLGLAIGAGAGLILETAFRKVITQADAEEASGLPFISSVRKSGIRKTSLPVLERPFSPAAEDYRRVGTALERQGLGADIKVLAILSADAKEGKTLLAANLAHSLARQGRGVVLVSSDLRSAQVEKVVGLRPRPGLSEALQDESSNVIAQLVSINEHLLVLPAGLPNRHPGELLASRRLVEIVNTLRQLGSVVILDTPPVRQSADAITLSGVADATLLVARSGASRMRSLREATSGLRRDRLRQLGVVLVGLSSPLLRIPYPNREHADVSEVGADERDLNVQPRPVQLISPRRSSQHDQRGPQQQDGERNVAWEQKR